MNANITEHPSKHHTSVGEVASETAAVVGGLSWSLGTLIVSLVIVAAVLISIPFLFFAVTGTTGAVIEEAAKVTGEEPHAPQATHDADAGSAHEVNATGGHDVSDGDPSSKYEGSAEKPEEFGGVTQ